jgi:crooked neck
MLKYEKIKGFYFKNKINLFLSKVWLSLAQFEASIDESDSMDRARDVFEQAYKTLRTATDKEERLMLVEHWLDFEVRNKNLFIFEIFFFFLL